MTTTIIDTTATEITPNHVAARQAAPSGFTRRKDGDLMDAARQWANRPADEAVWTVDEYLDRARLMRDRSRTARSAWGDLHVDAHEEKLQLVGRAGLPVRLNNWSMGQLASAAGAPASYMAKLPAGLAAECLTYGLQNMATRESDASLLLDFSDRDDIVLRGITTERYSRIWDAEIAERVHALSGSSSWGPAEPFRQAGGRKVEHAWGDASKGLPLGWVGDRSSFIALVDYEGAVDCDGTQLARFVLLSNSEVGAASFKVTFGFVDFVCCNFILWGATDVHEASFRHVGNVRDRVSEAFAGMNQALGSGARDHLIDGVRAARVRLLGDTDEQVIKVARAATGLPAATVKAGLERAHATSRYGNPRSVWAMLNGLTEESQHAAGGLTDKRLATDEAAARLMRFI